MGNNYRSLQWFAIDAVGFPDSVGLELQWLKNDEFRQAGLGESSVFYGPLFEKGWWILMTFSQTCSDIRIHHFEVIMATLGYQYVHKKGSGALNSTLTNTHWLNWPTSFNWLYHGLPSVYLGLILGVISNEVSQGMSVSVVVLPKSIIWPSRSLEWISTTVESRESQPFH